MIKLKVQIVLLIKLCKSESGTYVKKNLETKLQNCVADISLKIDFSFCIFNKTNDLNYTT